MDLRFDFTSDDRSAGFRLEHFELYNWGTYNKKIVTLELNKYNALLTGDIGSGKSTVVDALTTLLVPHNKITFNKAAGAESKERSLYSYVVGEYKATQDENFGHSKAISLRDESSFSVILGRFENIGYDESITLAQFFYITQKQVHKFFVVSKSILSIKKDFFKFEDIRGLKKSLRNTNHTEVFETFKEYSKLFRREMGIKNEQALNLFYQTVSLKSIGNLTEFIRTHMLEDSKIDEKIDELCLNFAELNNAHDLVLKAKRQIELLSPIDKEFVKYKNTLSSQNISIDMRESLKCYFAFFERELLEAHLSELNIELSKNQSNSALIDNKAEKLNNDVMNIKLELQKNGADRINKIEDEIKYISSTLMSTKSENETYNNLVKSLGYNSVSNEHRFLSLLEDFKEKFINIEDDKDKYQNQITRDTLSFEKYDKELLILNQEIHYLKNNRSNIPQHISKIRDEMSKALNINSDELPFLGELIEVSDKNWNGAIERILHSSAISLLVEADLYERVSEYVDQTNLKGKLVYLRVDTSSKTNEYKQSVPNSILSKVDVKVDSPYFNVVETILYDRFNISCVDNLVDFRRFKKALSIKGQFKTNLTRHEKDDRFNIDDKSRWVLGWNNLLKLEEFEQNFITIKEKKEFVSNNLVQVKIKAQELQHKRDLLRDVIKYDNFEKIDWYRYSKEIEILKDEQQKLEKSSDIIKTLKEQLFEVELSLKEQKYASITIFKKLGEIEEKIRSGELEKDSVTIVLETEVVKESIVDHLELLRDQLISSKLNLNTIRSTQVKYREHIQKEIESKRKVLVKSTELILKLQGDFIVEFPVLSKELYASVECCDEFNKKLYELKKDNLPKWQKKFKTLFKEKTIQNIVMLQSNLEFLASEIKAKISTINKSLTDIEYSDGTFIELITTPSNIAEIKEFKQELKELTSGVIDEDNIYDESKFLKIKELIERFNTREGYSDVDKKWRKVVTDVRKWFDFSANEKYMSDGSIKEHYAHSGGKSGGQKEKLAYTVLASSLAYQFGLEHDRVQSKSFRFVMIDEAFGRGSDESTKYALSLFEKLKLQLLVITPKQKINVIEPFVNSVHFVHNRDGMDSTLISMKIQEYIKNKKK
ncbi:MAG: ATP-dependent exonuclease SbcCD, C subunit-like protein [Helicobacteraceae bacterium]|nr:ATP-dependent exonuclease SbcCD, C subunit-like protein [Helicobacteraceae bacterium]